MYFGIVRYCGPKAYKPRINMYQYLTSRARGITITSTVIFPCSDEDPISKRLEPYQSIGNEL